MFGQLLINSISKTCTYPNRAVILVMISSAGGGETETLRLLRQSGESLVATSDMESESGGNPLRLPPQNISSLI